MNEVIDPLHEVLIFYCISYGPSLLSLQSITASIISESGSFSLLDVMGGIMIVLLSQSTITYILYNAIEHCK